MAKKKTETKPETSMEVKRTGLVTLDIRGRGLTLGDLTNFVDAAVDEGLEPDTVIDFYDYPIRESDIRHVVFRVNLSDMLYLSA